MPGMVGPHIVEPTPLRVLEADLEAALLEPWMRPLGTFFAALLSSGKLRPEVVLRTMRQKLGPKAGRAERTALWSKALAGLQPLVEAERGRAKRAQLHQLRKAVGLLAKHGIEVELAHARDPLLLELGHAVRKAAENDTACEDAAAAAASALAAETALLEQIAQEDAAQKKLRRLSVNKTRRRKRTSQETGRPVELEAFDLVQRVMAGVIEEEGEEDVYSVNSRSFSGSASQSGSQSSHDTEWKAWIPSLVEIERRGCHKPASVSSSTWCASSGDGPESTPCVTEDELAEREDEEHFRSWLPQAPHSPKHMELTSLSPRLEDDCDADQSEEDRSVASEKVAFGDFGPVELAVVPPAAAGLERLGDYGPVGLAAIVPQDAKDFVGKHAPLVPSDGLAASASQNAVKDSVGQHAPPVCSAPSCAPAVKEVGTARVKATKAEKTKAEKLKEAKSRTALRIAGEKAAAEKAAAEAKAMALKAASDATAAARATEEAAKAKAPKTIIETKAKAAAANKAAAAAAKKEQKATAAKLRAQAKAAEAEAKAKAEAKVLADAKAKAEAKAAGDRARAKARAEAEALAAVATAQAQTRASRRKSDAGTTSKVLQRVAADQGGEATQARTEDAARAKGCNTEGTKQIAQLLADTGTVVGACVTASMESVDTSVVVNEIVLNHDKANVLDESATLDPVLASWISDLTDALRARNTLDALHRLGRKTRDAPEDVLEQVEFAERAVRQLVRARDMLWARLQTRSSVAASEARQQALWCLENLPRPRSSCPLQAAVVIELRKCLPARLLRSLVGFAHAAADRHLAVGR